MTFLEKIREGINEYDNASSLVISRATQIIRGSNFPREHRLAVRYTSKIITGEEADDDVVDSALVNQLADTVYGDIKARLDKYLLETLIDDDARIELTEISEMMQ